MESIPPRTLKRLEKEVKINHGNGEATTKARYIACTDIRNCVSFAAANASMSEIVRSALVLNMDTTQFQIGEISSKKCHASLWRAIVI